MRVCVFRAYVFSFFGLVPRSAVFLFWFLFFPNVMLVVFFFLIILIDFLFLHACDSGECGARGNIRAGLPAQAVVCAQAAAAGARQPVCFVLCLHKCNDIM